MGEPPRNKQVRGISEATRPVLPQTSLVLKAVRLGPDHHLSGSGNLWPNCSLVRRVWIQRPHLPFLSHLRGGWGIVGWNRTRVPRPLGACASPGLFGRSGPDFPARRA